MRSLLMSLILTGAALAAPPKAVPLKVEGDTVVVVKSFPCNVIAPAGADVYFWSYSDALKCKAVDNVLTITAAPNGTYTISVTSLTVKIDFDKKTYEKIKDSGETTVVIGGVTPPKPPDPPGPLSPLAKSFKDAAAGDTTNLKALADFYAEAGMYLDVTAINTSKKLQERMRADAVKLVPADKLVKVRELIADEYGKMVSIPPDQAFTFDTRGVIRGLFKAIAAALEEASR